VKPRIAVTMGDPAGVGPEVIVKALAAPEVYALCRPVVHGDPGILLRAARAAGVEIAVGESPGASLEPGPGRIAVVPGPPLEPEEVPFGRPGPAGYRAMVHYIRAAAEEALAGRADAVVTCPIAKEGLAAAGVPFPGHTEFLAHLCGGAEVAMMLAGERLRVALATIHVALRQAVEMLTPALVEKTIRIAHRFFRDHMGTEAPRIAVAGLNPHAGEGGLFGDEEKTVIAPALAACRRDGIDASGPWPADTVFYRAFRGEFDLVVAMTHDQGLGPLKLVHFEDAVNVTMGLPIVRTSVDHGTAYDLAGTGRASPASLLAAIRMAARMAARRGGREDRRGP